MNKFIKKSKMFIKMNYGHKCKLNCKASGGNMDKFLIILSKKKRFKIEHKIYK